MNNLLNVAARELRSYFSSPVAYMTMVGFMVITAIFFATYAVIFLDPQALLYNIPATLSPVLNNLAIVLLLVAPAITMRLLAEEQRSGTIELLMTAPLRDWQVVVGKYLAALILYLIMLALTLYYPLILILFGSPDMGVMVTSYVGAILMGAAFLAVGVLASSMTRNQIIAAVLSLGMLLFLWLVDVFSPLLPTDIALPVGGVLNPAEALQNLSIIYHYFDFTKGIMDTRHILYYLSVVAICLFLATRILEVRRWR
ncbi:MAG: ABC transporter permease [Chloroflexi bacterium]|nr:ABC transporter permease [Chloroflexota bacterium]MBU1747658.1 ABC transporter permease [Chloroflexota bacterium]MBU1879392.1 ABC transporter permease [Chloroflexota bacterium]